MRVQRQLIEHDPANGRYGDCQRTCIAAILDLDAADVPHFLDDPAASRDSDDWWAKRQARWLAARGLTSASFGYIPEATFTQVMDWTSRANPKTPMILMGRSRLGSNHVVVVLNGEIVCDPSGNGIIGPPTDGDPWEVTVISVAAGNVDGALDG